MSIIRDIWEENHEKHVRAHKRAVRDLKESNELEQQTRMFWTVQLTLLELDGPSLALMLASLLSSDTYRRNKYTEKLQSLEMFDMSEKDRQCLATHLALQLCGIEE
jgi:hypothetical protein